MLQTIDSYLRKFDLRLLIFSLLCLNYLSLAVDENEEEYFAFAKYFMDPGWIPDALSVTDLPGTRILFEMVVGFGLRYLSFEQMALLGRCIGAALLSLPLALLFQRLRLSHLQAALFIQICCLFPHQSLFGKEWIFGPFETKTIAYALVLYSFYLLLESRYRQSAVFAGLSVWFHVLVGGWYTVILFIYLLLSGVSFKASLGLAARAFIITVPVLAYLGYNYLLDNPKIIDGISISWIYVYFRNAHHLAPFGVDGEISSSFLRGAVNSLAIGLFCLWVVRSRTAGDARKLALFFLVTLGQQTLFLTLAYGDDQGAVLKYYPFRTSALSFITALLLAFVYGNHIAAERAPLLRRHLSRGLAILIALSLLGLGVNLFKNLRDSYQHLNPSPRESDRLLLYRWIAVNTPQEAKFLNLNRKRREDLDFVRLTGRDRFSVYKFVPTHNRLIYHWYLRVLEKQRVQEGMDHLPALREKYRVDYLVSPRPLSIPGSTEVYANNHYWLYAL